MGGAMTSSNHEEYKNMVLAFRMTELQNLMVFAGRSKTGRKTDLQVPLPLVQHLFSLSHLKILSLSSTAYKGVPPTPITTRHPRPAAQTSNLQDQHTALLLLLHSRHHLHWQVTK